MSTKKQVIGILLVIGSLAWCITVVIHASYLDGYVEYPIFLQRFMWENGFSFSCNLGLVYLLPAAILAFITFIPLTIFKKIPKPVGITVFTTNAVFIILGLLRLFVFYGNPV